jgi:transposase-like protein
METKRKYRRYEIGFKRQVVQEVDTGAISLTAAARKYELSPNLINEWRDKFREGALVDRPSRRERELEKENELYKKLLAEKCAELEFAKKAQACARRLRRLDTAVITGQNIGQFRKDAE